MKPKSIGIVGGAGPLGGAALLECVLSLSMSTYGCTRDAEFPKILLLSFPFSEMLVSGMDIQQIRSELKECLKLLRESGASVLTIARNTLHAFLDEQDDLIDLIHMQRALETELSSTDIPLVLCTSTSMEFGLHKQYFPCVYQDSKTELRLDKVIDRILEGAKKQKVVPELLQILQRQAENIIILGCTELSLYTDQLLSCRKVLIDPLRVLANKILEKIFSKGCY